MYYLELFDLLNRSKVKYLVVGGVALVLHGVVRFTADIDIMLDLSKKNLAKFFKAMKDLGFTPKFPVKMEALANAGLRKKWAKEKNMVVFSLIKDDYKIIDVFTENPIDFDKAYSRKQVKTAGNTSVDVVSFDDLIDIKRLSAREQDMMDIKMLEALRDETK